MIDIAHRPIGRGSWLSVFVIRLVGIAVASLAFGLIAASAFSPWSGWVAAGLTVMFGGAFLLGSGYRMVWMVWQHRAEYAPPSWSGASFGCTLACAIVYAALVLMGLDGSVALWAFAVAINLAYLLVRGSCIAAGCCHAPVGKRADLRVVEIVSSLFLVIVSWAVGLVDLAAAALIGIGGHTLLRLSSHAIRGRGAWGFPPLRQPGAELGPLYALFAVTLVHAPGIV